MITQEDWKKHGEDLEVLITELEGDLEDKQRWLK
jgi:hypothetical protein